MATTGRHRRWPSPRSPREDHTASGTAAAAPTSRGHAHTAPAHNSGTGYRRRLPSGQIQWPPPGHEAHRPTRSHLGHRLDDRRERERRGQGQLAASRPQFGGHRQSRHRQQQLHRARGEQDPDRARAVGILPRSRRSTSVSRSPSLSPGLTACLGDLQGRRPEHPGEDQGVHATGKLTRRVRQVRELAARVITVPASAHHADREGRCGQRAHQLIQGGKLPVYVV